MRRCGSIIRSELPANREDRINYKRRSGQESFGVYRPLTLESELQVRSVLAGAIPAIAQHLNRSRVSSADTNQMQEMGVTFLERGKMERALRKGWLRHGFEPQRMKAGIEDHLNTFAPVVEVPLDGFGWVGRGNRKLSAWLDVGSDVFEELEQEKESVKELLTRANAPELEVYTPNHLTVLQYGFIRDGQDLGARDQKEVRRIVHNHFLESGVDTISLGSLVVGETYSQPKQLIA